MEVEGGSGEEKLEVVRRRKLKLDRVWRRKMLRGVGFWRESWA